MRVLFCLSGEMRGFPSAIESLCHHVIDNFNGGQIDLIANVRLDPWWKAATELPHLRMLHVERNHGPLDESVIITDKNPLKLGRKNNSNVAGNSNTDRRTFLYQSYLQYYRSLKMVGEMKREVERQDGKRYDWVFRVRPDVFYEGSVRPDLLIPGVINFPENDTYGWLSDKFAAGSSEHMDVYFNRMDYVSEFCQHHELMAEHLLAWQLEKEGIGNRAISGLRVDRPANMYEFSYRPDSEEK